MRLCGPVLRRCRLNPLKIGSNSVDVPDFTRGQWKTNKPVALELEAINGVRDIRNADSSGQLNVSVNRFIMKLYEVFFCKDLNVGSGGAGANMIKFVCSECGQSYRVSERYAGKRVRCKNCSRVNMIPLSVNETVGSGRQYRRDQQSAGSVVKG